MYGTDYKISDSQNDIKLIDNKLSLTNFSNSEMPPVKIPNNILTRSLRIRKSVSIGLFVLGAVAAAVAIAAAVASLAFAVAFLPLAAIVGIGITPVALLTAGIILRLKKDTLSEENLPEVIKLLSKSDEKAITSNEDFVGKVIEFCNNNKVSAELFNKECNKDIKLLSERSKNLKVDSSNELTKNLKSIDESIKKNYDLIESISSLKEGEKAYNTGDSETDFKK